MYFEELGHKDNSTVVLLHGAFFADSFVKQYSLSDRYHLVVPHIKGFGKSANELFTVDAAVAELVELIEKFAPVYLVGFSLGAQLAFKIISERSDLVKKAVIVSPWLINKDNISDDVINGNLKMLSQLKNKMFSGFMALSMGLPKPKRAELVNSMRLISKQTVINSVDNEISLENCQNFKKASVPVLALAGVKEPDDIIDSVKQMSELNDNCTYELWKNAKHNIPTAFSKQFIGKLRDFLTDSL